jgi:hypothetical protein
MNATEERRRITAHVLANETLQLTAPREHHGSSGSAQSPTSALVRALDPERRS